MCLCECEFQVILISYGHQHDHQSNASITLYVLIIIILEQGFLYGDTGVTPFKLQTIYIYKCFPRVTTFFDIQVYITTFYFTVSVRYCIICIFNNKLLVSCHRDSFRLALLVEKKLFSHWFTTAWSYNSQREVKQSLGHETLTSYVKLLQSKFKISAINNLLSV